MHSFAVLMPRRDICGRPVAVVVREFLHLDPALACAANLRAARHAWVEEWFPSRHPNGRGKERIVALFKDGKIRNGHRFAVRRRGRGDCRVAESPGPRHPGRGSWEYREAGD